MKKLFSIFIAALMLFSLAGCGEPEVRVEYVDNYRSISVERLTKDNFGLIHPYVREESRFTRNNFFEGTHDTYVNITQIDLEVVKVEAIQNSYNEFEWVSPSIQLYEGREYAMYLIELKEIREYSTYVRVVYDLTFEYNLFREYNKELGLYELNFDKKQTKKVKNYVDYFEKGIDVVVFDLSLYL